MKNNLEREYQGQIYISAGSPLNIYSLTDDEYTTNEVAAILGFIVLGFGLAFLLIRGSNKITKKKNIK